jgi:hypothetical protein
VLHAARFPLLAASATSVTTARCSLQTYKATELPHKPAPQTCSATLSTHLPLLPPSIARPLLDPARPTHCPPRLPLPSGAAGGRGARAQGRPGHGAAAARGVPCLRGCRAANGSILTALF